MRFNDKSTKVQLLQNALITNGYDLPNYGADGFLGKETWQALHQYSSDKNIEWNPLVPKSVRDSLENGIPVPIVPAIPTASPELENVRLYDLRSKQSNPPEKSHKFRITRRNKVLRRNPSLVTGITIHQTAVKYSVNSRQVNSAGGDRNLALANRSLGVACHLMVFHDGFIAWPNPLDWYIFHGNSLNSFELGIEIDGNYPGLIGGDTWNNKPATQVTEKVVQAACSGIELLVRKGREMGMPLQYIHAHRQASASRRSDPGEELWKRVVLDYCVPILGLTTEPKRNFRSGQPIPVEWDSDGSGHF